MKLVFAAAAIACLMPAAAFAQTAPETPPSAPAPDVAPAPAPSTARFNLDTPIEALAADPAARAVIEADIPPLFAHPQYEAFKGMSLRQLQPMSGGAISAELLTQVETDLAAIQ